MVSIPVWLLVVIVIGGLGSVWGALVASILVGCLDTAGRIFLPQWARTHRVLQRRTWFLLTVTGITRHIKIARA